MKTTFPLLLLLHGAFLLSAQSTTVRVYEIFQEKCQSCHSQAAPAAGLDLEGAGATLEARALDVRGNLFNITPSNSYAASQGYKHIYPGRPDRSFLFRKVNLGMEPSIVLHPDEGAPKDNPELSDLEKELIRQWVLFGAPANGAVVEEQLLVDFYNGQGQKSFPNPPAAPSPGEGFQLKMGPFYLAPSGQPNDELEFFLKHELQLPNDVEVNRMEILMSGYSHHFILYNFTSTGAANNVPHGLRTEALHQDIGLFAAVQEATDLDLPEGTAFTWADNLVLDFNSHYINYSAGQVYQSEAYINVYTQPVGTAAQEMQASLLANTDIFIPNNGDMVSYTQTINYNLGEVYLWGVMGHTHKYGEGYKVYKRVNGQQGDLIYDASCAQGIPGCVSPFFDYQHIPMRYFEPLKPVQMNFANGLIHEASWINNGPTPLTFGPTSDDEMMVLILMYTLDSAGVVIADAGELPRPSPVSVSVQPNPLSDGALFAFSEPVENAAFRLFDAAGSLRAAVDGIQGREWYFERGGLPDGIYFYDLKEESGVRARGKLILQSR